MQKVVKGVRKCNSAIVLLRSQKTINKEKHEFSNGQKINFMKEAKYLWMIMVEHFTFKNHMDTVEPKLNRAN